MATNKLSVAKVKLARPGKHEDGGGLRLYVSANLSRSWVFRFTLNGMRHEMGLGSCTVVSLANAREMARSYRALAAKGVDPRLEHNDRELPKPTFISCAAKFIQSRRRTWTNRKHTRQWISTLRVFACPLIGKKCIDNINTDDIVKILQPIWHTKTETAKRLQGRIENIIDYAIAHNLSINSNPARWKHHLDKIFQSANKVKKVRNMPAMPFQLVPDFYSSLCQKTSISALALRFLILNASRTSEVIHATWGEIDFDQNIWVIAPERMKVRKEHVVPLSAESLKVLSMLQKVGSSEYIFPGKRYSAALSNMAMLELMRGMGYGHNQSNGDYVPHGFRSSFRDWASETTYHTSEVIEKALSHTVKNKVEAAYRRGNLLDKRRSLMSDWATFLTDRKCMPQQERDTKLIA